MPPEASPVAHGTSLHIPQDIGADVASIPTRCAPHFSSLMRLNNSVTSEMTSYPGIPRTATAFSILKRHVEIAGGWQEFKDRLLSLTIEGADKINSVMSFSMI